jgi:renalase
MMDVAIIGAGLAGLACADALLKAGLSVQIFEKSRGLGGRLATRRRPQLQFDHGAQYVTAKTDDFRAFLSAAVESGNAEVWQPKASEAAKRHEAVWYVGKAGMSSLVSNLADRRSIRFETQIQSLTRRSDKWHITDGEGQEFGPFRAVVAAIPAPQAQQLLTPVAPVFDELSKVEMLACATAMVAFDRPLLADHDVLAPDAGVIGWAARDSSKPARDTSKNDTWVIQARPAWSSLHLETEKGEIARLLFEEFAKLRSVGQLPEVTHIEGHRWRYAYVARPLGRPFVHAPSSNLMVVGDWCLAARAEAAFTSGAAGGQAMAAALL